MRSACGLENGARQRSEPRDHRGTLKTQEARVMAARRPVQSSGLDRETESNPRPSHSEAIPRSGRTDLVAPPQEARAQRYLMDLCRGVFDAFRSTPWATLCAVVVGPPVGGERFRRAA